MRYNTNKYHMMRAYFFFFSRTDIWGTYLYKYVLYTNENVILNQASGLHLLREM